MRTRETQSSKDNHQSGKSSKPFFSNDPSHAFFSSQRAQPAPFFQPKGRTSSSGIQAKSATAEGESINQPVVQRQQGFESDTRDKGTQERSLLNPPPQSSASPIQAMLNIGQPNDKYEQEAERVASMVVEQINTPAPAQSPQGQSVQRMSEPEEELQAKGETSPLMPSSLSPDLQREAIGGGEASADLTSAINSARGGGHPLAPRLQTQMGQAMGADFSGVRVHTDGRSDRLNQSIQAKAFTTGQDVFFRQGAYEPESRGGQELIAHELTHVVQQKGTGRGFRSEDQLRNHPMHRVKGGESEMCQKAGSEARNYDSYGVKRSLRGRGSELLMELLTTVPITFITLIGASLALKRATGMDDIERETQRIRSMVSNSTSEAYEELTSMKLESAWHFALVAHITLQVAIATIVVAVSKWLYGIYSDVHRETEETKLRTDIEGYLQFRHKNGANKRRLVLHKLESIAARAEDLGYRLSLENHEDAIKVSPALASYFGEYLGDQASDQAEAGGHGSFETAQAMTELLEHLSRDCNDEITRIKDRSTEYDREDVLEKLLIGYVNKGEAIGSWGPEPSMAISEGYSDLTSTLSSRESGDGSRGSVGTVMSDQGQVPHLPGQPTNL